MPALSSLAPAADEHVLEIEQKMHFFVFSPARAQCTVEIKGPIETKAEVITVRSPEADNPSSCAVEVRFSLPQPGVYFVDVALDGKTQVSIKARSAALLFIANTLADELVLMRMNGDVIRKIGTPVVGRDQMFARPMQVAVATNSTFYVAVSILSLSRFVFPFVLNSVCTG